jgi:glucuronate isomerase
MSFIHDDFLLPTAASQRLYHEFAEKQPIIDYHCHLPPEEVAGDKRWDNLGEIWLGGDHYKWRAMRTHGITEDQITGKEASWKTKFDHWAATVPHTLRNPLYHWTHLELKRVLGIDELLSPATADSIWAAANERIASPEFSAQGLLKKFDVHVVGTTDDPCDSLEHHIAFAKSGHPTKMVPTFRPDKAMALGDLRNWNAWVDRLSEIVGKDITTLSAFISALESRHAFFHENGARLSDHGLQTCPYAEATEEEITKIFDAARSGRAVHPRDAEQFATYILQSVGRWNARRGWTMQLHLGALRNNNSRMMRTLGPDTGFDSIDDSTFVPKLSAFLNSLDTSDELPKTILYNLNPAHNYPFATMIGNFQKGPTAGKVQFGSGWWFLDQLEGMTWQLNALSSLGLLSHFVGMLTDSRSFLSYPRHEYFRRLLCRLLGAEMEGGQIPMDFDLVGDLVARVSYGNASTYFGFPK